MTPLKIVSWVVVLRVNRVNRDRPWAMPAVAQPKEEAPAPVLPWEGVRLGSSECPGGGNVLKVRLLLTCCCCLQIVLFPPSFLSGLRPNNLMYLKGLNRSSCAVVHPASTMWCGCLQTSMGNLGCLAYGDRSHPLVLCLHGYPSSARTSYGKWLLPALVQSGYYAVALDMPGCGDSCGKHSVNAGRGLRTRSEYNLAPGNGRF